MKEWLDLFMLLFGLTLIMVLALAGPIVLTKYFGHVGFLGCYVITVPAVVATLWVV